MTPTRTPPHRPRVERQAITVPELAAKLEKRLYADDLTEVDVRDACVIAKRQRLGGVITRPEHIRPAAEVLRGCDVALGTALLCISMGVDRFNGDVDQLLADAARAEWLGPLTIPLEGYDY